MVSHPKGITYTYMESDKRVQRRIFGHKMDEIREEWSKVHNDELLIHRLQQTTLR
jgi:hypothetical protein